MMGCAGVGFFGFAGLCRTGGLSRSSETSDASDWSDVDFSVRGVGMGRRLVAAAASPVIRWRAMLASSFPSVAAREPSSRLSPLLGLRTLVVGLRRLLASGLASLAPSIHPILIFATALTVFIPTPFGATSGLWASPGNNMTKSPG